MRPTENRPGVYGLEPLLSPSEFWDKIVGEFDPVAAKLDLQDMLGTWICSEDAERSLRHRENVWFHYTKLLEILNYYEVCYSRKFQATQTGESASKDEVLEQLLQRLDLLSESELRVLLRLSTMTNLTDLNT